MRRSAPRTSNAHVSLEGLSFDGLEIDEARRVVSVEGTAVDFTAKEFDLLSFLAARSPQVFSRGHLLEHVWGSSPEWQDPATITVHIRRIRQKIEKDPQNPRWVKTVWGVGYRFEP